MVNSANQATRQNAKLGIDNHSLTKKLKSSDYGRRKLLVFDKK